MKQNLELEQAIELMANHVFRLPVERLTLQEAHGCVLAEDVTAPFHQPPFHRSPLDGYAVYSGDIADANREQPVYLDVIDTVYAGDCALKPMQPGQAVKIMTGAMLPDGCDCVVRQEDTDQGTQRVAVYKKVNAYENYRFCGEEYRYGDVLLPKDTVLDATALSVLAGAGIVKEIPVYRKPSVAVITTGSEIVPPYRNILPDGKVYSVNDTYLLSRLQELGICNVISVYNEDNADMVANSLEVLMEDFDLVITTGAVSVGERDMMHDALPMAQAEQIFWRVRMKPGTPAMFSVKNGKPILSLSGNPFAAAATFELLARPLLAMLSGNPRFSTRSAEGTLAGGFSKASPGRRFIRARYAEDGTVHIPDSHASGIMASFAGCNCLVDIPAGSPALSAGQRVKLVLL